MKRIYRLIFVFVAMLMGLLVPATLASAHTEMVRSEPAASSVLAESPTQIVLYFNESIEPVFASIRILDQNAHEIVSGDAQRDSSDHSIVRASTPQLGDGAYVVVWRVTSVDGHPIDGTFPFYIGTKQEIVTDFTGTELHTFDNESSNNSINPFLRWVLFVGVIVLIGSTVLAGLLMPSMDLDRRSIVVVWGAWLLAFFGSVAALITYGPNAIGASFYNLSLIPDTLRTAFGQATIIRIVLLGAIAVLIYGRRRISQRIWRVIALLLSIGIVATLSLSGHPIVQNPAPLSVAIDIVHLLAVSIWIGGIVMLTIGFQSWNTENGIFLVRRFSNIVIWAVLVIVITGVVQAWVIMGGFGTIFSTIYGRTLLVKSTAVVVLVSLGALSRSTLKRNGPASVKRVVGIEMIIGLIVIAITSLLVGTAPRPTQPILPFSATLVRASVIVNVTVTPTRVGQAEVHIIVTPPGGVLGQVISVNTRMSMPERNIPNIPIELIKIGPNHFTGVMNISYPGMWELEVLVVPTPNATLLYQTSFRATD